LSRGTGELREERRVNRADAVGNQVVEDEEQGQQDEGGAEDDCHAGRDTGGTTAPAEGPGSGKMAHSADSVVASRRTSRRARKLTATDTRKRMRPVAMRAERCSSPTASANSLAMMLAIVAAGANNPVGKSVRLPMTMVTAIVSPRARPSERTTPPMIPARACGSTAMRITSRR